MQTPETVSCNAWIYGTNILVLITIMLVFGCFGGYVNYLFDFDTVAGTGDKKDLKNRYRYLGAAGAFLVPLFLVISNKTDLLSPNNFSTPSNYLIFSSYCLIAAIFSRTLIRVIGEKISEELKQKVNKSVRVAEEAKQSAVEVKSTVEAVKAETLNLKIDNADTEKKFELNSPQFVANEVGSQQEVDKEALIKLIKNFDSKANVSISEDNKIKFKTDLGRQMGEIIVRNGFDKRELYKELKSEGMLFGIVYSIILKPTLTDTALLKSIAGDAIQASTKYRIAIAFDTLLKNNYVDRSEVEEIKQLLNSLYVERDEPLINKLDESKFLLSNY